MGLTPSDVCVKLTSAIFLRNKLPLLEFFLGKSLSYCALGAKDLAVKCSSVKENSSERQGFQRQASSERQSLKSPGFERFALERLSFETLSFETSNSKTQLVLKDQWAEFSLP